MPLRFWIYLEPLFIWYLCSENSCLVVCVVPETVVRYSGESSAIHVRALILYVSVSAILAGFCWWCSISSWLLHYSECSRVFAYRSKVCLSFTFGIGRIRSSRKLPDVKLISSALKVNHEYSAVKFMFLS